VARTAPFLCLIGVFALIGLAPLALAISAAPPSGQTAVLFDPRLDRREVLQAVAASDATLVRFGALPGSAVVDTDEGGRLRLSAAGAWLLADPILLGGCRSDFDFSDTSIGNPI